ncbi:MAG: protein-glutamate O-methyltransferase CheR [Planctomycetota bacterium]|nr:protein-glutamate O-methyltransferase CheR [Planctomycetota bacterium]
MDAKIFEAFRELIYRRSGIALRNGKESMVAARIAKRMRALNISDHAEYLRRVESDPSGEEVVHLLDAIATNVTKFFREPQHFDFLAARLAEWLASGQRRFRFWSAACSTGEEPYTLAMTLREACRGYEVDLKILATDISTRALERAMAGAYGADKVEPVPAALVAQYFERRRGAKDEYHVREEIRRLIVFRRLNLAEPPFPMRGPLDAVLCRNVMIYFDNDVRRRLLAEIERLLKPGGFLMVGHAESLTALMSNLRTVVPSIYVKR